MQTLRNGSRGASVDVLQLALNRTGYSIIIDGIFGSGTEAAVKAFQAAHSLTPDGIVGQQTWAALTPWISGYTAHQIVSGDTFWNLAHTYGTTVEAIRIANPGLLPQSLQVGAIATIPFAFNVVPFNVRYPSWLVPLVIDGLVKRYPFTSGGSVGKSILGSSIEYIKIGSGTKTVGYNASHHANEWITTPLVLRFAEDYARAIATGGAIYDYNATRLAAETTLYVVPMVNPDGVDLVNGVISSGESYEYAKAVSSNYPSIPFPNGWKANIKGTDLNLNYPARWEQAREIKYAAGFDHPAPRDYVGTAPLSEPESRAMAEFSRVRHFSLILAYHTQGEVIYWKFADYNPPNSHPIALRMGASSGYAVETTPEFSAYAGYKDWFIQEWNRPGYTIEAGLGVSPLPLSDLPTMYRRNIGIMAIGLDATT